MKALILEEYNRLEYKDAPDPKYAPNEVLVQVKACGICGSDVHGMDGSSGRRIPPLIMGHEAAGVIAEVGRDVKRWKSGDRVTFDSTIYQLDDWFSRKGLCNLSEERRVLGVSPGEYSQPGAFAEFVAVPQHILYRVPDGVSFEQAAMTEPIAVAAHAVRLTPICIQDTVLVTGIGMIGIFLVQVLKHSAAGTIIGVDIDDSRLDLAKSFGADQALNSSAGDFRSQLLEWTEGRGADIAFEAVGIAETVSLSVESVRKGGIVTLIGNLAPKIDLPLQSVVTREIRIQGSCAIAGEFPLVLKMIAAGHVRVDPLISAVAPLSEGVEWFERLRSESSGLNKVILVP